MHTLLAGLVGLLAMANVNSLSLRGYPSFVQPDILQPLLEGHDSLEIKVQPFLDSGSDGCPFALWVGDKIDNENTLARLVVIIRKDWNTATLFAAAIREIFEKWDQFAAGQADSILEERTEVIGAHDVLPAIIPASEVNMFSKVD
ncbi:unnamed protein product [Fusarium venenatum]|uniref:Uncharacterized protein n=1 Tax=Fusarium venenatum TaxID=56646 RepID=A0A2L2TB37_9HYPO|nr:uncharacterized protein FVRRES_04582 [Fusarium venenatum]CEI60146.1 unnamed protein product [Fusarium venenatum]